MAILADTPSSGLLFGAPVALLLFLVSVGALVWGLRSKDYDRGILIWGGLICAVIVVGVSLYAFWPFKHDYHFWVPVNDKVEKISSRLISAGDRGGSNQRFVVVIRGEAYGVDDTRASLLHVGDRVSLKCKREFEWGSSYNGWGCRWNGRTPT